MISRFRVNRVLYFQTAFALLTLASLCFAQGEESSAVKTVSEFYSLHFARGDRMYFSPENIRRKRKWLTPGLYRLMLYEFRRERECAKANADQPLKPYFSGDVFTDSGSSPQVFRVTGSKQDGDKAWVTVVVYWNDNTVGKMKRRIRVVLAKREGNWLIDNLLYEQGKDLVSELKRPNYY
jgi:hypothetical protein